MKNQKKYLKKKIDYNKVIPLICLFAVLLLTVGYSAVADNMSISGIAVVKTQPNVKITGISYASMTYNGVSNSADYGNEYVDVNVTLPSSNSTVTYNITVLNAGNVPMTITDITGLPANVTYRLNNFTFKDGLCDNQVVTKCTLGSVTTISITILYNKSLYDANNTTFDLEMNFTFSEAVWVAKIGERYFGRIQGAVDTVATNDTEVTVDILANVTERITVMAGQRIYLNIGNHTLYGDTTGNSGSPVIETDGAVRINNGTISTAASQGAINVTTNGSLTMTGGSIIATGTRQAIYNNGGTTTISGTAYLRNASVERAAVQNLNNGNLIVLGGTIISLNYSGIISESGTLTIGAKDGTVSTTDPYIQGKDYGVYNYNVKERLYTELSFYDGSILGRTGTIYNDTKIIDTEVDYGIIYQTQNVDGVQYQKAICSLLSNTVMVTFDFNDESGDTITRSVESGTAIGTPPVVTREHYVFDGWYADDGITPVDGNTIVDEDTRIYAHWIHEDNYFVAKIGSTNYKTFAAAISAVTTSTPTTIELIRDTTGNVTISSGRNITLDFGSHTLSSADDAAVIINKGNCTMISGTISTASQTTAAINNESSGNFTISGGRILATGKRQAIYNNAGRVTISGSAYLEATTAERATVHNFKAGGTITITGGTIVSPNFSGVNNAAGTLTVGVQGGGINTDTPIIRGATYGVQNSTTFNYYDGTLYGVSNPTSGSVTREQNTTIVNTTEVIGGVTYKKAYLQAN